MQNRGDEAHLSLGLCFPLRAKPILQRRLDRILNLERVYPAQPWRVPERCDGRTHARPTRDSGRIDILGNGIRECLLCDTKSFGSYAYDEMSHTSGHRGELTDTAFMIKLSVVHGKGICLEELDSSCIPQCEPNISETCYSEGVETHRSSDPCSLVVHRWSR